VVEARPIKSVKGFLSGGKTPGALKLGKVLAQALDMSAFRGMSRKGGSKR